jgi:hypothetical protein
VKALEKMAYGLFISASPVPSAVFKVNVFWKNKRKSVKYHFSSYTFYVRGKTRV